MSDTRTTLQLLQYIAELETKLKRYQTSTAFGISTRETLEDNYNQYQSDERRRRYLLSGKMNPF